MGMRIILSTPRGLKTMLIEINVADRGWTSPNITFLQVEARPSSPRIYVR